MATLAFPSKISGSSCSLLRSSGGEQLAATDSERVIFASVQTTKLADGSIRLDAVGMSSVWERIAENRIAEAFEQGEFENLPGKGRQLDLTPYFNTPSEDRMAFSILKNAGVVPSEVELMSAIAELERRLQNCTSPAEAQYFKQQLQAQHVKLTLAMERRKLRTKSG